MSSSSSSSTTTQSVAVASESLATSAVPTASLNSSSPSECESLLSSIAPSTAPFVKEILLTDKQIRERAKTVASEISDYGRSLSLPPSSPLLVVGLLKGAIPFLSCIVPALNIAVEVDYIAVHSYTDTQSTGSLNFRMDTLIDVKGRHVLVVDDILDTGTTLLWVKNHLKAKGAATVKFAVMLDKKERRTHNIESDFVAFNVPNYFVVGYGLDFNQKYRELPFVAVLSPECYKH